MRGGHMRKESPDPVMAECLEEASQLLYLESYWDVARSPLGDKGAVATIAAALYQERCAENRAIAYGWNVAEWVKTARLPHPASTAKEDIGPMRTIGGSPVSASREPSG